MTSTPFSDFLTSKKNLWQSQDFSQFPVLTEQIPFGRAGYSVAGKTFDNKDALEPVFPNNDGKFPINVVQALKYDLIAKRWKEDPIGTTQQVKNTGAVDNRASTTNITIAFNIILRNLAALGKSVYVYTCCENYTDVSQTFYFDTVFFTMEDSKINDVILYTTFPSKQSSSTKQIFHETAWRYTRKSDSQDLTWDFENVPDPKETYKFDAYKVQTNSVDKLIEHMNHYATEKYNPPAGTFQYVYIRGVSPAASAVASASASASGGKASASSSTPDPQVAEKKRRLEDLVRRITLLKNDFGNLETSLTTYRTVYNRDMQPLITQAEQVSQDIQQIINVQPSLRLTNDTQEVLDQMKPYIGSIESNLAILRNASSRAGELDTLLETVQLFIQSSDDPQQTQIFTSDSSQIEQSSQQTLESLIQTYDQGARAQQTAIDEYRSLSVYKQRLFRAVAKNNADRTAQLTRTAPGSLQTPPVARAPRVLTQQASSPASPAVQTSTPPAQSQGQGLWGTLTSALGFGGSTSSATAPGAAPASASNPPGALAPAALPPAASNPSAAPASASNPAPAPFSASTTRPRTAPGTFLQAAQQPTAGSANVQQNNQCGITPNVQTPAPQWNPQDSRRFVWNF